MISESAPRVEYMKSFSLMAQNRYTSCEREQGAHHLHALQIISGRPQALTLLVANWSMLPKLHSSSPLDGSVALDMGLQKVAAAQMEFPKIGTGHLSRFITEICEKFGYAHALKIAVL